MTRSQSTHVLALIVSLVVLVGAIAAWAAPMTPYSTPSFAAAQNADQPIVVFVHASW